MFKEAHKAVESVRSAEFQPKALKSKLTALEEQKEKLNEKLKNIRKKLEKVVHNQSIDSANDLSLLAQSSRTPASC